VRGPENWTDPEKREKGKRLTEGKGKRTRSKEQKAEVDVPWRK